MPNPLLILASLLIAGQAWGQDFPIYPDLCERDGYIAPCSVVLANLQEGDTLLFRSYEIAWINPIPLFGAPL
jgi:hypothetical protein